MHDTFSYSRVDTFVQCGFKYKLKYEDGHYIGAESIALSIGTAIHEAEEAIANALIAQQPIDYTSIKNKLIITVAKIQAKFPEAFNELDKAGKTYSEKIQNYLKYGIYRLENYLTFHEGYRVVAAELPILFNFQGTNFKGSIDRVIYDSKQDRYIIQDIKTYAKPLDAEKLEELPLQFIVYTLAASEHFKLPVDKFKCQYDLPFCDTIQNAGVLSLGPADLSRLSSLLAAINNKEFIPNPSPLCAFCEYSPTNPEQPEAGKGLCPYHSLWTKAKKSKAVASEWQGLDKHEKVLQEYLAKYE